MREVGEGGVLTRLVAVSPDKVNGFLKKKLSKRYVWSEDDICLAEHLLVGPFEFVSLPDLETSKKMEKRRVDAKVWERLIVICQQRGLNTAEINRQSEVFLGKVSEWSRKERLRKVEAQGQGQHKTG